MMKSRECENERGPHECGDVKCTCYCHVVQVSAIESACGNGHDPVLDPFYFCWFIESCADSAAKNS